MTRCPTCGHPGTDAPCTPALRRVSRIVSGVVWPETLEAWVAHWTGTSAQVVDDAARAREGEGETP